ncbi:hypothetical protein GUITHDRAFT_108226 [Guillardia theta CCMP2712]|uniref:Transcription factor CBF/NF-Y/archaeal histone domain-containing protein n=2 Tax=Guillardia theta TaxID=55529 RepID=L1JB75_GUITC|nr:hypothetical protein GUITHDRAFT_108226 [Guillardia theta CCMP2712]EKX45773.1 hypothetical protein GUITHDRAFT_108226 [Guillardia theta CCMP2712]|eukprot:XP_005832753.1 hypothetical protein GUITHDRAFT_108226 [Guillardia theta CCMP2712]
MVEVEAVGQEGGRMEVEGSEEKEPISTGSYARLDEYGGTQAEKDQAEEVDAEADKDEGERGGDGENQGTEEQEVNFPYARIKRIMRKNPDKKKNYSRETIHAMTVCTELFLVEISKQAHSLTMDRKRKTMQLQDIGDCIKSIPRFEFLDGPGILPEMSQKKMKTDKAQQAANQGGNQEANQGTAQEGASQEGKQAATQEASAVSESATGGEGAGNAIQSNQMQAASDANPSASETGKEQPQPAVQKEPESSNAADTESGDKKAAADQPRSNDAQMDASRSEPEALQEKTAEIESQNSGTQQEKAVEESNQ